MMQIKGEKSQNYDRYAKAMGLAPGKKGNKGPLRDTLMPSERAALEREMEERNRRPDAPNIQSRTVDAEARRAAEEEAERVEDDSNDSDLEDLMEDHDDFMAKLREKRIAELKKEQALKNKAKHAGQGEYSEIKEDEFIDTLNKSKHCLVHFYHKDFKNCLLVDKHLKIIAEKHMETRIVKLNAEKAPFFVSKLLVRTLPTVIAFIDGVVKCRLVGFEDFGRDDFQTQEMEAWFRCRGMLKRTEEDEEDEQEAFDTERERRFNPIRTNLGAGLDDF
jgi:hypothetical protein